MNKQFSLDNEKDGKVHKRALWYLLNDYIEVTIKFTFWHSASEQNEGYVRLYKSINELNLKLIGEMFNIHQKVYDLRNEIALVQPKYN